MSGSNPNPKFTVQNVAVEILRPKEETVRAFADSRKTELVYYGASPEALTDVLVSTLVTRFEEFLKGLLLLNLCGAGKRSLPQMSFDFQKNPTSFTLTELPFSFGKRRLIESEESAQAEAGYLTCSGLWPAFGPTYAAGPGTASPYLVNMLHLAVSDCLTPLVRVTSIERQKMSAETLAEKLRETDAAVLKLASPIPDELPSEIVARHITPDCMPALTRMTGTQLGADGKVTTRTAHREPAKALTPADLAEPTVRLLKKECGKLADFMSSQCAEKKPWSDLTGDDLEDWAWECELDSFMWMDFTETLARAEYALELTAGCPDLRVALLRDELMQRIPLLKEFRAAYLQAGCPALTSL